MKNIKILVTNDDGIHSPGLRAAVEAVHELGTVIIAAPSNQQTAAGRGLTGDKNSTLTPINYTVNGTEIRAFHSDCSPALVVKHYLRTIGRNDKLDLVVSGINYGENLGINVTSSGTVGAALEAACSGIPAIAASKVTDTESHRNFTDQDWTASIHFVRKFANLIINQDLLPDVEVLKIDVPDLATRSTPWKITKLANTGYYTKAIENPSLETKIGDGKTIVSFKREKITPDTDIYATAIDKIVSITPLSTNLTSRIGLSELDSFFRR